MSFESLNLDAALLRAIEASGFKQPTEIQIQAIPVILQGQDLMASAQTGTGKTAAFVLPLLQKLLTQPRVTRGPRVMVLTPTRELAAQVEQNIRQFSQFIQLKSAMVVGGEAYPPQIKALQRPLDLLVATPGRLMDHMERGRQTEKAYTQIRNVGPCHRRAWPRVAALRCRGSRGVRIRCSGRHRSSHTATGRAC